MSPITVAVVVGSLRKDSYNLKLAAALEKLAPQELAFDRVRIDDLPLYSQDFDADYPQACVRLKQQIEAADAVLLVTPEYNRSIPGVLKNAIDIASRPARSNSFAGKPAGVIGMSPGAHGTVSAQQHLRNVLAALNVAVLPQPEVAIQFKEGAFDAEGNLAEERTRKYVQGFLARYVAWVQRHLA